jgi:hypothetical protein
LVSPSFDVPQPTAMIEINPVAKAINYMLDEDSR